MQSGGRTISITVAALGIAKCDVPKPDLMGIVRKLISKRKVGFFRNFESMVEFDGYIF